MITKIALLLLTLGFAGCTSQPPAAERLTDVKEATPITVSTPLSYARPGNARAEQGLMPGEYVAERENDQGTFYKGKGRPIWVAVSLGGGKDGYAVHPGGIWVPKDPSKSPRMYLVREASTMTVDDLSKYTEAYTTQYLATGGSGNLVAVGIGAALGVGIAQAFIEAAAGTIYIFDESPEFIKQVSDAIRNRVQSGKQATIAKP